MNIENPYKVNTNHNWDKDMSADLVEEIYNGKMMWKCYLFAASAVTPMRVVEFGTMDDAEKWARDKGAEIWTYFSLDDDRVKHCVRCEASFIVSDTDLNVKYCSSDCRRFDHDNQIIRDNEGNIIAGRMREKVRKEYKPGQTIDKEHCIKKDSLDAITKDIYTLAEIECSHANALTHAEIVFVDSMGNQYEYDGVCISEGKLKVSIKPNKEIMPLPKVQRKYFNFENELTVDMLPFNQDTLEKIRLERECMEKDIEGSIMNRSEIWHYLSNGFTITTYQADYVLEGHDFAYDEITKK